MSHFTHGERPGDVIWAIMTQGLGFSCLFVPLTTVALSSDPAPPDGRRTGLNGLFRQVGGSVGLAVAATLLTRFQAQARMALVAHVDGGGQATRARVTQLVAGFSHHGFDAFTAKHMALRALGGVVQEQAMLLAFDHVFLVSGVAFLFLIPLLWFLKTPEDYAGKGRKPAIEVSLE